MSYMIRNTAVLGVFAVLLAGALAAAPGVIRKHDGTTHEASNILSETVSGISWEIERNRPGVRIKLWEIESLRYRGQEMDEFNSLPRKLAGGLGSRLVQDANDFLSMEPVRGFSAADWKVIQLAARYYRAQGFRLQGQYEEAARAFEQYLTEAEANTVTAGIYGNVTYRSPFSDRAVNNAGGLHRYYLDALEALGSVFLHLNDVDSANKKGFTPLQELSDQLSQRSGDRDYYNWALRALRSSAIYAEDQKEWPAARDAYERLQQVAMRRDGGRASRESNEAMLKVGYMEVKAGNARLASARFIAATRAWEQAHIRNVDRMAPPRAEWINPDEAFVVAGSYVGMGMVEAAGARNVNDWARALRAYSLALAMFDSGQEIRSLALLGAAQASAKLAELNASSAKVADNYARLAEKYLNELQTLIPNSRAASDESIPEVSRAIQAHKAAD